MQGGPNSDNFVSGDIYKEVQCPWDKIVMQYHEGMQPIVLDASPLPETNESLPIVLTEQARSVTVKIWVKKDIFKLKQPHPRVFYGPQPLLDPYIYIYLLAFRKGCFQGGWFGLLPRRLIHCTFHLNDKNTFTKVPAIPVIRIFWGVCKKTRRSIR